MANLRSILVLLGFFMLQGGCGTTGCGPTDPDPCELDRLGCGGDAVDFPHLDSCAVSDPLVVSIGEGDNAFAALDPGAVPELHHGFQGGQHFFLGFRVENPALDLYDQLKVTLWVAQGPECAMGPHAVGAVPESCQRDLGFREVVIGGEMWPLHVVDGAVEEYGLLVVLDFPSSGVESVAAVEVEDPCGRTGSASVAWTEPVR